MSKETAVTEKISYNTDRCDICDEEVVIDDISVDVVHQSAYAVVLSNGDMSHEFNEEGNWNEEFTFKSNEQSSELPLVEGHIICATCAKSVHQQEPSSTRYTGNIPSDIINSNNKLSDGITNQTNYEMKNIFAGIIVFLLLILILFALL